MTSKKKGRSKLTVEELRKSRFRKSIKDTFINAGFHHFKTLGREFEIERKIEIDYVFAYENIFLICEDTTSEKPNNDHKRRKNEAFELIDNDKNALIDFLITIAPDKSEFLKKYTLGRLKFFFLYFTINDNEISTSDTSLYSKITFVQPGTLKYLQRVADCIKYSARYEIFRFLKLNSEVIGIPGDSSSNRKISRQIMHSEDNTGLSNGIKVVSFMMSAEMLIRTAYVLRKDAWEMNNKQYQRLMEKEKIQKVRKFLSVKGEAFYNNIIVSLPKNVFFLDDNSQPVDINRAENMRNISLCIPDEFNTICIIDGQHRVFAHYEAPNSEKNEAKIAQLRNKLHLLVTGLIYPSNMSEINRSSIESQIFLDINSNAKPVRQDILIHIEMLKNLYSDVGLARAVIEQLNKKNVFKNLFELSALDVNKIKIASIIRFALRYLVTITPQEGDFNLFSYWNGDKDLLLKKDDQAYVEYIMFCTQNLDIYFSAVKSALKAHWEDQNSKILSVVSLNGFIIAFHRQLRKNAPMTFEQYKAKIMNLGIDFSKEDFPYTSSQYRKFSSLILQRCFDLDPNLY